MTIDGYISLISPDNETIRKVLAFPTEEYGQRFVDIDFWRPSIDLIAARHGLRIGDVTMGQPGTFSTFILNRSYVIKLFGAPFDGLQCWQVERQVVSMLDRAGLPIPVPELIADGVLSRDPDWAYTITPFLEGEPFAERVKGLPERERIRVARDLGVMIRPVHDVVIPSGSVFGPDWTNWLSFVDRQTDEAEQRHRGWNILPEHLLRHVDRYVADYRLPDKVAPSLVHSDLHGHHLFGELTERGGWSIRGVIDWGDARVGDRFYDLPALHLGLFHGDKAMLAAFLESYGWGDHRSDAFVRKTMIVTLLHEFNVLAKATNMEFASLDQLADAIWRV